jgi:hypothetical protein
VSWATIEFVLLIIAAAILVVQVVFYEREINRLKRRVRRLNQENIDLRGNYLKWVYRGR